MLELLELMDMLEILDVRVVGVVEYVGIVRATCRHRLTTHISPCQQTKVNHGKPTTRWGCDRIEVMKYNYEKLEVYQLAKDYATKVYKLTSIIPKEEQFGLISQIRRAAVSVVLNIVEGSSRKSKKDFAIFVERSIGSLIETRAAIDLSVDLGYTERKEYDNLDALIDELFFKLQALKKSLRSDKSNDSNKSNKHA